MGERSATTKHGMADQDQPPVEPTATSNIVHALLDPDDLVAVLRSQLFIEYAIEQLIATVTGEDSRPLFEHMSFNEKIKAAQELGLIERPDVTALQAVAKIRNKFAHRLGRVLTKADDKMMYDALRGEYKETYRGLIVAWETNKRYSQPGFGAKMALTTIFRILSGLDPKRQAIIKAIGEHERGIVSAEQSEE